VTAEAKATDRVALLVTAFAIASSVLVLGGYAVRGAVLVAYPWDWSPDEGLSLDYGRRLLESPGSLYARTVSPFPSVWGPFLPLLLAPIVAACREPLAGARLLASAWTAAAVLSVFLLVRRAAPVPLALVAAALALTPFDLSFWYMLVRGDGLMIALWLLACVPLLPSGLGRGADQLSKARIAIGAALMLAAVLTKPTAAIHGAPLVLGWLFVDRRSAVRLWIVLGAVGLATIAVLQWWTGGAFVWVNRLWGLHPAVPGLQPVIWAEFFSRAWPVALFAGLALAVAVAKGRAGSLLRDPALLLVAGGLAIIPMTSKLGAWWNYLLPLLPALAVLVGRWWGALARLRPAGWELGQLATGLAAALALLLASTSEFPLPNAEDESTARNFYGYVEQFVARRGGPILATRPDLAYFLVGQPVEIEGTSYEVLAAARAPGTERVLKRLQDAEYTLLIEAWPYPGTGGYLEAARRGYALAGSCELRFYFGLMRVALYPRFDRQEPLRPTPAARCVPSLRTVETPAPRRVP
jgi:hypothetical protein